jgi:hypothetical protein
VQVGELLVSVAANNPNCYNVPCPEDKARADADNLARAAKLSAIAAATSND